MALPTDATDRKNCPIFSGVLRYFPDALAEVAIVSKKGNDQHNPGQPLHWDRSKSTDEGDALVRHQLEAGTRDTDGMRHSAKVAWRALAQLQKEIEADEFRAPDYNPETVPEQPTNPRSQCLATYNAGSGASYTCTRDHGHEGKHEDARVLGGNTKVVLKEW